MSSHVEPARVDEPGAVPEYAAVFSRVATEGGPIIVRRGGTDLAAVITLDQLQVLQEVLAHRDAERRAAQINWDNLVHRSRPPQSWFDDTADPCAPEPGAAAP